MKAPQNQGLANPEENQQDGYFDTQNPISVWSKLGEHWSGRFQSCLSLCPGADEHLHDETVFKRWVKKTYDYTPGVSENRFRFQFWHEYENSVREHRQMQMTNVYQLICSDAAFHKLMMSAPERAVWLLVRPAGYEVTVNEMLHVGLDRMRRVLEADPYESGRLDHKLLALQLKISQWMDMRKHGAPTQKIQQMNLHATIGQGDEVRQLTEKGDMATIQKRLEALKARKAAAEGRGLPAPKLEGEVIEAELVPAEKKK